MNKNRDMGINTERLNNTSATILSYMGKVGVYHLNKLHYLFEYLFIKNFGRRFTQNAFIKLPHGPVIPSYKVHINELGDIGIARFDRSRLNIQRRLDEDDFNYSTIFIESGESAHDYLIDNVYARSLLYQVVKKYGRYSVEDLEKAVYSTTPVKNYLREVEKGYKSKTGGYVLKGSCIRFRDYQDPETEKMRSKFELLDKLPKMTPEQYSSYAEEFEYLEELRPALD